MRRPRTGSATKQSRSGGVAVQQLDVDVLRAAQKGNPNPGPDRRRLPGELGALLLQLGDNVVNAADPQSDMLEPEIGGCGGAATACSGGTWATKIATPPRSRS